MKQRDLIKRLEDGGFIFERHGGNHDIYRRGSDIEKVPRHKELNENLARMILIVNDITNFCFRLLQKPYTAASARPKTKFLMSLTIKQVFSIDYW